MKKLFLIGIIAALNGCVSTSWVESPEGVKMTNAEADWHCRQHTQVSGGAEAQGSLGFVVGAMVASAAAASFMRTQEYKSCMAAQGWILQ